MNYAIDIALVIALVAVVLYVRRERMAFDSKLERFRNRLWTVSYDLTEMQLEGKRTATEADIVKGAQVWILDTEERRVYCSPIYHTWREKPELGIGYFGVGSERMPSGHFLYNPVPFKYFVEDKR